MDTIGGGGGASGCVVNDGSTVASCAPSTTTTGSANGSIPLANDGWLKPTWQTGVSGIPSDGVRDIPDVSFFAADGFLSSSAYLICVSDATVDSQCAYSSSSEPVAQEVGGTSVATPAMAGVMALINQKTGAAQGNPNAELYKLASQQTYSACSAESVTAGSTSCYFNDIDQGTNAVPCDYSAYTNTPSPNCTLLHSGDYVGILPGYSAGAGYDLCHRPRLPQCLQCGPRMAFKPGHCGRHRHGSAGPVQPQLKQYSKRHHHRCQQNLWRNNTHRIRYAVSLYSIHLHCRPNSLWFWKRHLHHSGQLAWRRYCHAHRQLLRRHPLRACIQYRTGHGDHRYAALPPPLLSTRPRPR